MSIYVLCLPQKTYRKLWRACPSADKQALFGKRPYAFLGPSSYRSLGGDPANEHYRPRSSLSTRPRTIRLTPVLQDRADTTFISPPREFGKNAIKKTLESRKRALEKMPSWVQALVKQEDIGGWVEEEPTRVFKYEEPSGSGRGERWNVMLGKDGVLPRPNERIYLMQPLADTKQRENTVRCYLVAGTPSTKNSRRVKTASVILYPC